MEYLNVVSLLEMPIMNRNQMIKTLHLQIEAFGQFQ